MNLTLAPRGPLRGEARAPGDKSITHRALLLAALGQDAVRIRGYLDGGDCRATIDCLRQFGVAVDGTRPGELLVQGVGLRGLAEPHTVVDCVRSGTTMRLLTGILAGQSFYSVLAGDPQLLRRPMGRVVEPLAAMGAHIWGRADNRYAPLAIQGGALHGATHRLEVASAQVKSCLLLAGLYADGETVVIEPGLSRDHTERMLQARGAAVQSEGLTHRLSGPVEALASLDVDIPGDFSSAAFLLGGALLTPGSCLVLRDINLNETRTGLLDALALMGAQIEVLAVRDAGGEPLGDLVVTAQTLHGAQIGGSLVPRMIDEFPLLALLATQAEGVTLVTDAAELRVKETDRIATVVAELRSLGARIEPTADGFSVKGPTPLRGAAVDSYGDHRLAMTLCMAALIASGETTISRAECMDDSFPGFAPLLASLLEAAP
jgi:3-phosphoshikimate 1-carboxyvinyltransferase